MESKGKEAFKPLNRERYVSKSLKAFAMNVSSADMGGVRIIE